MPKHKNKFLVSSFWSICAELNNNYKDYFTFLVPEIRAPDPLPVDPCNPNPCGNNAECRARGERPVCSCPRGYDGDPLTSCRKGECVRKLSFLRFFVLVELDD